MSQCGTWIEDLSGVCPCSEDDFAPGVLADWALVATELLYRLSGQQYPGVCVDKIRPCRNPGVAVQSVDYVASGGSRPLVWHGGCVDCSGGIGCGCTAHDAVRLPHVPVRQITEVKIDGVALTADDYRLVDRRWLIRSNGAAWPCCNDLAKLDTEEGTFSVAYTFGNRPPAGGEQIAGILACELAKGCAGDESCRLPRRTQQITREGISMTIVDPYDFFDQGRTGLYEVDAWLRAQNPGSVDRAGKAINPGTYGRARRVV